VNDDESLPGRFAALFPAAIADSTFGKMRSQGRYRTAPPEEIQHSLTPAIFVGRHNPPPEPLGKQEFRCHFLPGGLDLLVVHRDRVKREVPVPSVTVDSGTEPTDW